MPAEDQTAIPAKLRCDVTGCQEEMCIRIDGEQRCYDHALERGNEIRASKGLPPIVVDDEGDVHVRQ
jgi:hypothetical protein